MNQSAEKVVSYLTGNGTIDAVTVEDLQKHVSEYPYFPVTQFLLAKKLKGENKPEYTIQAQKTTLYFSNPYWLQYQMTEAAIEDEPFVQKPAEITNEEKQKDGSLRVEPLTAKETNLVFSPDAANESTSANIVAGESLQPVIETYSGDLNYKTKDTHTESVVDGVNREQITRPTPPQVEEEMAATTSGTNEETESFINHLHPDAITAEPFTTNTISEDTPPAVETEIVELKEEMAGVTHDTDNTTETFLKETQITVSDRLVVQDDEHDRMFQNIKAMLDASSEEADADTNNAIVLIDPYYTIDYFASQGIKLELDKNPQDQLGQNLKKFTQWLKHMKKLGPEDATEAINRTESEADILQIADSSNTVREVVTEAMATVLEKQGKKEKAIELYNKLSFLYPNKNAYFADKIKKLKGI